MVGIVVKFDMWLLVFKQSKTLAEFIDKYIHTKYLQNDYIGIVAFEFALYGLNFRFSPLSILLLSHLHYTIVLAGDLNGSLVLGCWG